MYRYKSPLTIIRHLGHYYLHVLLIQQFIAAIMLIY